ncbi:MAG: hypothetical protein Q8N51_16345 [Gammaproteobacteria bacterium]|nr:hypothetical protein [Gammaproteobacteria bacterium]
MSSFDLSIIFPGRAPPSISDAEFLRAIKALGLPTYQARGFYAQFGKIVQRPNDWALFTSVFAPAPTSSTPSTRQAAALTSPARGGIYPYRKP